MEKNIEMTWAKIINALNYQECRQLFAAMVNNESRSEARMTILRHGRMILSFKRINKKILMTKISDIVTIAALVSRKLDEYNSQTRF